MTVITTTKGEAQQPAGNALNAPKTDASRHGQRRERTDEKIMRAALDLILTRGIGAVSIEAIAKQSGVAKTTIYRRYSNVDDLLQNLCPAPRGNKLDFSDLEPSYDSLRIVLTRIIDGFDKEFGLKAIGMVLTSNNQHLHALADRVIGPVQQRFSEFIAKGMASGAFKENIDVPFVFQTVIGAMMAAKALSSTPHSAWVDQTAALLYPAISAS